MNASAVSPEEIAIKCLGALETCNMLVEAKKEELRLCDLGVKVATTENERLQKEVRTLREADSSLWRNPWVWGAVGVIVGVYTGARATR